MSGATRRRPLLMHGRRLRARRLHRRRLQRHVTSEATALRHPNHLLMLSKMALLNLCARLKAPEHLFQGEK